MERPDSPRGETRRFGSKIIVSGLNQLGNKSSKTGPHSPRTVDRLKAEHSPRGPSRDTSFSRGSSKDSSRDSSRDYSSSSEEQFISFEESNQIPEDLDHAMRMVQKLNGHIYLEVLTIQNFIHTLILLKEAAIFLSYPLTFPQEILKHIYRYFYYVNNLFVSPSLSAGHGHAMIIINSELFGCGSNKYSQLGNGQFRRIANKKPRAKLVSQFNFLNIGAPNKIHWKKVSCGGNHTLAISNEGLYGWGKNDEGALGIGGEIEGDRPKRIEMHSKVLKVQCGYAHSLIETEEGLFATGSNQYGQLGLGDNIDRFTFQRVDFTRALPELERENLKGLEIISIGCGNNFSVLITRDYVFTWGCNDFGQLGADFEGKNAFVLKPALLCYSTLENPYASSLHLQERKKENSNSNKYTSRIISTSCGNNFMMLLTNDGTLYSSGANVFGTLGLGDTNDRNVPTRVNINEHVLSVTCGANHVMALTKKGIYGWGLNTYGQLGFGDFLNRSLPSLISFDAKVFSMSLGNDYTIAISDKGVFYCGKLFALRFDSADYSLSLENYNKPKTSEKIIHAIGFKFNIT